MSGLGGTAGDGRAAGHASGLRRWLDRRVLSLGVTLCDQAIVSCANFLLNVLLLKGMGLEAFGVFSLCWVVAMVAMYVQVGLIVCPLLSIGPKQPAAEARAYHTAGLAQLAVFSTAAFALIWFGMGAIGPLVTQAAGLEDTALPLGVAVAAVLMQDGVRRTLFARARPLAALANDAVTYWVRLAFIAWVTTTGLTLTVAGTLWVFAATAGLGAALGIVQFGRLELNGRIMRGAVVRHWASGKWLAASGIMQWFLQSVFVVAAGALAGPAAVGVLRAGQTLVGLLTVLLQALENILPQHASQALLNGGRPALLRFLGVAAVASLVPAGLIVAVLAAFPAFWIGLIFGPELLPYRTVLVWQALTVLLTIATLLPTYGLRALERTRASFTATVIGAALSAAVAGPCVTLWGVEGATAGQMLVQFTMAVWLAVALSGCLREHDTGPHRDNSVA